MLYASRYYEENRKLPSGKDVSDFLAANYALKAGKPKLYIKDDQIWLEADSDYKPYFMSMFSPRMERVSAKSATPLSKEVDMEIVLALDTTGSMKTDNKIGGLKTAASNFVTQILDASTDYTRVKVGLAPFAQYVNVGLHNRNASWMDVPDDQKVTGDYQCWEHRPVISESNCRMQTYYDDGVARERRVCDRQYGEPEERCGTPTHTTKWNGCVGSRGDGLNLEDAKPRLSRALWTPGVQTRSRR